MNRSFDDAYNTRYDGETEDNTRPLSSSCFWAEALRCYKKLYPSLEELEAVPIPSAADVFAKYSIAKQQRQFRRLTRQQNASSCDSTFDACTFSSYSSSISSLKDTASWQMSHQNSQKREYMANLHREGLIAGQRSAGSAEHIPLDAQMYSRFSNFSSPSQAYHLQKKPPPSSLASIPPPPFSYEKDVCCHAPSDQDVHDNSSWASCSTTSISSSLPTETRPPRHLSSMEIEVEPGVFLPLLSTKATVRALQQDLMRRTFCSICTHNDVLYCMDMAAFVLCPTCRVISPCFEAEEDSKRRPVRRTMQCVGMGMHESDYRAWYETSAANSQADEQVRTRSIRLGDGPTT